MPDEQDVEFQELMANIEPALNLARAALRDEAPPDDLVLEQETKQQFSRSIQIAHAVSLAEKPSAFAHIRQSLDLLPTFADRISRPRLHIDESTKDAAELKRLSERFSATSRLIGAAYTEAEFLRHQRGSLRSIALDLRRFERRHHLTVVLPPFPTNPVVADPNVVFFSGSSQGEMVVREACRILGMHAATQRGIEDQVHARWQQLRQSGLAIFDFSGLDLDGADEVPRGPMKSARS